MITGLQTRVATYIKNKVIDGYMLTDLQRMTGLPVVPNQVGNCNFPITMFIFACMEFLGSLVSEQPIPDRGGATQDRVWAYIEQTFGEYVQEFEQHRATFVDIFRHGLIHEFFAKNAGVSRKQALLFSRTEDGMLVLDADRFHQIFRDSCSRLQSLMDSSEKLTLRMVDRYLALQRNNFSEYPVKLRNQSPSNTQASGATGARGPISFTTTTMPSFPPDEIDNQYK